jgi:hypothetical protein
MNCCCSTKWCIRQLYGRMRSSKEGPHGTNLVSARSDRRGASEHRATDAFADGTSSGRRACPRGAGGAAGRASRGHCPTLPYHGGNITAATVYLWLHRFTDGGLAGLEEKPRQGRPATYTREQVGIVVQTALTKPQTLGLPFASWTLDRLAAYLAEEQGIAMKRSRIAELRIAELRIAELRIAELRIAEGLRWRKEETWFGERVDPDFAQTRGRSSRSPPPLPPPASSSASTRWVRKRPRASRATSFPGHELPGPRASRATSFPGHELVDVTKRPAERAKPEIDSGRRAKGSVFGAFQPATGEALTGTAEHRTTAHFVAFLDETES